MKISFYELIKIAPIEQLKLSIGIELAALIIKNETTLHRFSGKDSFVTELKNKSYVFDKNEVYVDYRRLSKLMYSLKNNMLNYDRYFKTRHIFPYLKFIYQDSWNDIGELVGLEFKQIDGFSFPVEHEIWRKIYPPNHVSDNCSISPTRENSNSTSVIDIPQSNEMFGFDFLEFYHKHKSVIKDVAVSNNNSTAKYSVGIDIDKLIEDAIKEVYGDK